MLRRRGFLRYATMAGAGAAFSLAFPSLQAAVANSKNEGHVDWDYEQDGEDWGELAPDFKTCEMGTQQSPINLEQRAAIQANVQNDMYVNYHLSRLKIVNNGHTIQVNTDHDNHLRLEGTNFDLLQFHFHHLSEHTIDNKYFPLEAHLVHRNNDTGELAVLGVLFEIGQENYALKTIWENLPKDKNVEHSIPGINIAQLLPANKRAYRYNGSLTTPPCSQIVRWVVLKERMTISQQQLAQISQLIPNNNRPIQPGNHRIIIEG